MRVREPLSCHNYPHDCSHRRQSGIYRGSQKSTFWFAVLQNQNTYYEYSMTNILAIHVASLLIRQITSLSIISFMPSLRAHSLTSTCCCMHQKIHFDCSTENQQVHWPPFLVLSKIEWCMHLDISGTMQSSPRKFKQIINNKAFWGCNMVTNTKKTTITNVSPALQYWTY